MAVAMTDAHVALPAVGIVEPGNMLMIMGTSSVHLVMGDGMHDVPGICSVLDEAVYPGVPVYEAGQCCVGDHFDWFVHNLAPASYATEAHARGMDLHRLLTEKAASLKPGENGLIALDWWNGNRSILMDSDLGGLILGLTLSTRPEEIYRALIEATAYGTRMIIDNFEANSVRINKVYACGGIAWKNSFIMQLYADVLGRTIHISSSEQAPALASAIMGALAAGAENGGYDDYTLAAEEMGGISCLGYEPDPAAQEIYTRLYGEYKKLHDFFGRGGSDVMKTLKTIKKRIISGESV